MAIEADKRTRRGGRARDSDRREGDRSYTRQKRQRERASEQDRQEGREAHRRSAPVFGARYVCDFQAKYNGMHGKQCGGCGASAVGMKAWDGCVGAFIQLTCF